MAMDCLRRMVENFPDFKMIRQPDAYVVIEAGGEKWFGAPSVSIEETLCDAYHNISIRHGIKQGRT